MGHKVTFPHAPIHQIGAVDALSLSQYDYDNGQLGMYGTAKGVPPNATASLNSNKGMYLTRFKTSRAMTIHSGMFAITQADNLNDNVLIGIYNSSLTLLGSSISTASKLNSTGRKLLVLQSDVPFAANTIYYSAFANAYTGSTSPVAAGLSIGGTFSSFLFSAAEGTAVGTGGVPEMMFCTLTTLALPATSADFPALSAQNAAPVIAWREF